MNVSLSPATTTPHEPRRTADVTRAHYSGATRKGNVWLLDALTQAAWAAGRVKDDYLSAQF